MHWKAKGLIQKGLGYIPGGVRLNSRLQQWAGGLRDFEANAAVKLEDWAVSVGYLHEVSFDVRGTRLLEIGTGWYPALPFCFSLAGAHSVATFDIARHLDARLTARFIAALGNQLEKVASISGEALDLVRARFRLLQQEPDSCSMLNAGRIEYFAPADARFTQFEPDSVDLVYSNSVLEHIPADMIRGLMEEAFRVLKPGGLALHNVGCNDHYAFSDKSISFVNYLQFNEQQWELWNNPLQYQNRLRAPEFVALAESVGFEVIQQRTHSRAGSLDALTTMSVAPQFRRFSNAELALTTMDFISRKPTC